MLRYLLLCAVLALACGVAHATAAGPLRLQLASGRQLDGELSPRTGRERLWLVQRSGAAQIARPIAWDRIIAAQWEGKNYTSRELQELLADNTSSDITTAALAQPTHRDAEQDPFQEDPLATEELPMPSVETKPVAKLSRAQFLALTTPPVASVRFDAHLANWDADVEADGLAVQVIPVDAHGRVVPVRGALHVELFGVRRIPFQDAPTKRGRSYDRLGRWVQQLVPEYIDSDGGWFKLPFQAAQPEFDPRIGYVGLVHVKLVVPGAGVFEDSLDGVRLRAFAPLRDALELDTGHRFFPTETTGRGKRGW